VQRDGRTIALIWGSRKAIYVFPKLLTEIGATEVICPTVGSGPSLRLGIPGGIRLIADQVRALTSANIHFRDNVAPLHNEDRGAGRSGHRELALNRPKMPSL
jgi:hypothetical protein